MTESAEIKIVHNPALERFEVALESHLAVLEYKLGDEKIVFTHTGVPEALGGRGLGSQLARAGLDYARANGLKVIPLCSFIAAYIQKHPDYQDLIE